MRTEVKGVNFSVNFRVSFADIAAQTGNSVEEIKEMWNNDILAEQLHENYALSRIMTWGDNEDFEPLHIDGGYEEVVE